MAKWMKRLGTVLFVLFLGISAAWVAAVRWVLATWAHLSMEELVYQLTASIEGTNSDIIVQGVLWIGIPLLIALVAAVLIVRIRNARCKKITCAVLAIIAVAGDIAASAVAWTRLDAQEYLENQSAGSTFIEDHYVDPETVALQFPAQKRNLIYIYLESMKMTYADFASGGGMAQNVIPELTQLALDNECFAGGSGQLNGGYVMPGTSWTMGGMFGQSSGLPLKTNITDVSNGGMATQKDFFPGLTNLGDILNKAGYKQVLMVGSDGNFAGRKRYFVEHGDYEIQDYNYALETGRIPSGYYVWWGHEDEKLFSFAKEELETLAAQDQPFNLTMLTVNTHFEDGYICDLCGQEFGDNQYANVMACSSRQVAEFVQWIQQQDFYENTTIVLSGDHLTMDSDFCNDVSDSYDRRVYTAYINPAAEASGGARTYTTLDNFPTTLAALGVEIDGDRLGLGTNLFSSRETLAEEYGVGELSSELAKRSEFVENMSNVSVDDFEIGFQVNAFEDGRVTVVPNGKNKADVVIHDLGDQDDAKKVTVEISDENGGNVQTVQAKMQKDRTYKARINLKAYDRGYGRLKVIVQPYEGESYTKYSYTGQLILSADFTQYLANLSLLKDQGGYAFLVAARDDASSAITPEMQQELYDLGFTTNLAEQFRSGYIAIYNDGEISEQCAHEKLYASGELADGASYAVISAGRDEGNMASIQIDNVEHSVNERGLSIAVYDCVKGRIVNCAHFDTFQSPTSATLTAQEDGTYELAVDAHGVDWWYYYPTKVRVWDAAHKNTPQEYTLERSDDGYYVAQLDLAGMNPKKCQLAVYLYFGDNDPHLQLQATLDQLPPRGEEE